MRLPQRGQGDASDDLTESIGESEAARAPMTPEEFLETLRASSLSMVDKESSTLVSSLFDRRPKAIRQNELRVAVVRETKRLRYELQHILRTNQIDGRRIAMDAFLEKITKDFNY